MRVYIETLGCPKNTVDSEVMAGILERYDHEIVGNPEFCDVMIVNTCAFINDAKQESIDTIFELASLKENDVKKLIVSGCLSQRYGEELYESMPEVDGLIGVNQYSKLPEIIAELCAQPQNGKRCLEVSQAPSVYEECKDRKALELSYTNYLRIAEGCNNVCAYCVIPSIRGGYRSRSIENIVNEAKQLTLMGCKEIVLVAQDLTAYGFDLYGEYKLPELIRQLCKVKGMHWLRLMYCYEDSITDELIETIAQEEKVCKYIDIPLQHVSDSILTAMNRRSTNASIRNTINRLRKRIPDIHIRTTFITGFPGETDEDFEELCEFVEEMEFDRLGVFAYSPEEGTPAAGMSDQVPEEIKRARQEEIMSLQRDISLKNNEKKIGKILEVIVEEMDEEEGTYLARTQYDAREIDNSVIFSSPALLSPGDFINVKITDAFDYDLVGEAIPMESR